MKRQRTEDVIRMLWRKNLGQEYGEPINDSVFRDTIKEIQETRWERNLFVYISFVLLIGIAVLTHYSA